MFFASPIWLALLLPPWAAVAAWLMWSRRGARTDVPFLALWRGGSAESPTEKREFRPPPVALVATLLAILLAIVASARPGVFVAAAGEEGPLVTIIVDRGVTMSTRDRLTEVIEAARPAVLEAFREGPTDLVVVPDGTPQHVSRAEWSRLASSATPTQEQTADSVRAAVARALAKTSGPVVVMSDQAIATNPRVVQIAPAKPLENVAITNFVVRETPRPQAMIVVANNSPRETATLRVRSGERNVAERAIDLPRAAGGEAKFFVDLPSLDAVAVAEIDVADDIAIDNVAHAKRQRSFPAIEVRAAVPAEVRRVVEAYGKSRPANEASRRVAVVADDAVPTDVPVAIVAGATSNPQPGPVTVAAHPVSAGVDWADAKAQASGTPSGEGWRAIVSIGGNPAVAVREAPHRQVWIGFDAPDFARTPAFVIFWTNVFDWLAGDSGDGGDGGDGGIGEDGGADDAVADAARHWTPTVVPPIRAAPPSADDWREKLAAFKAPHRARADVTSPVLLASVICLIVAALGWPGRSLTPISAPRTV